MRYQPLPDATNAETDKVYTPHPWADLIVRLSNPSGRVLDPSRGKGAFYDQFPEHCDKLWCELDEGRDFFEFKESVDWVITNPPWSVIRQFMEHAMDISNNVVFLITANHAMTKARVNVALDKGFGIRGILHMPTPPKPWPQSGFQLSAIWWMRGYVGPIEIVHASNDLGS